MKPSLMRRCTSFRFQPLLALLLGVALAAAPLLPAAAQALLPAPAQPSLAQALNPDGTLRPDARGSFDARHFQLLTAPNGQPVFRPGSTSGADDYRWQSGFGLPEGTNGTVTAVLRVGTAFYIGGEFTAVGNVAARHIARWDGTAWSSLGTGPNNGTNGTVEALAVVASGDLYVGGSFNQAGTMAASGVARWNGTSWSALGTGLTVTSRGATYAGDAAALAVASNGNVYVGGYFDHAGSTAAGNIAQWNGTTWSALGAGVDGSKAGVYALVVTGSGDVYAGGSFDSASGVAGTADLARWNGTAWSAVGTGLSTRANVNALALASSGDLYVGGYFSQAGPVAANNLARWNGTAWNTVGTGLSNGIQGGVATLAIATNGDLYVGGSFNSVGSGNNNANSVARWNGTAWSAVGTVVSSLTNPASVKALALAGNGDVFIGGRVEKMGGYRSATWPTGTAPPGAGWVPAPARASTKP